MSKKLLDIFKENNAKLFENFTYPIYKESKKNGSVVKFFGLDYGNLIKASNDGIGKVGLESRMLIPHTDTDHWMDTDFRETLQFPIYKRAINTGIIVRFDSLSTGNVVYPEDKKYMSNYGWIPCTNNKHWRNLSDYELDKFGLNIDRINCEK